MEGVRSRRVRRIDAVVGGRRQTLLPRPQGRPSKRGLLVATTLGTADLTLGEVGGHEDLPRGLPDNFQNTRTPLRDWFDDAGWKNDVLPQMAGLAGAAKLLGFDGLALDQEMYPQVGNIVTASWSDQSRGTRTDPRRPRRWPPAGATS